MSICKSCGASIFYALTEKAKRMPVDREPVADGNIEITGEIHRVEEDGSMTATPTIRVLKKGEGDTLFEPPARYKSHFATCPNAAAHRG